MAFLVGFDVVHEDLGLLKGLQKFDLDGTRAVCAAVVSKNNETTISEATHFGSKHVAVGMGIPGMLDLGHDGEAISAVIEIGGFLCGGTVASSCRT